MCKGRAGVALPREILFFKGHCPHRKSLRDGPTCWASLSHGPDTPEATRGHTQQEMHTVAPASKPRIVTGSDKFPMPHRDTKASARDQQEKPHSTAMLPFPQILISLRFVTVDLAFCLFLCPDSCIRSAGKRETLRENNMTSELQSRRLPGKKKNKTRRGCFSIWSPSGDFPEDRPEMSLPSVSTGSNSPSQAALGLFASWRLRVCFVWLTRFTTPQPRGS